MFQHRHCDVRTRNSHIAARAMSRQVTCTLCMHSEPQIKIILDQCQSKLFTISDAFSSVAPYEKGSKKLSQESLKVPSALAAWGLDERRQVCITTDNAVNMVKAAALNKWTRLQCFGHKLHYGKLCPCYIY